MFITSLSEMERIVSYRSDLEWDGWDVVRYKNNSNAQYEKSGIFKNGKWYTKTVFPLSQNGWSIPDKLGSIDA